MNPNELEGKDPNVLPRRTFFSRVFGGIAALGFSGVAGAALAQSATGPQKLIPKEGDLSDWPGQLKGKHRMLIDILGPSNGDGFVFAHHFLRETKDSSAVVMLRGRAVP